MSGGGYRGSEWWKYDRFRQATTSGSVVKAGALLVQQSLSPGEWRITLHLAATAISASAVDPSEIFAVELAGSKYEPLPLTKSEQPTQTNEKWFQDRYEFSFNANEEITIRLVVGVAWDQTGLLFGYMQSEGNEFPKPCGCRK